MIVLFGAGRDEGLNQKTINRKVIAALQAMRGAGAEINLKKGDWPKTTDVVLDWELTFISFASLASALSKCSPREATATPASLPSLRSQRQDRSRCDRVQLGA
jgi:hypothetical protein